MGPSTTCEENFVEIIEQCTAVEPVTSRKYCGTDNPVKYVAKCNRVVVHMQKNSNFGGTGWLMNFMGIGMNANEDISF